MVKIYKQPFAHDGDTIAIPDASQPDGKMSSADGWTPDYQLPRTDPNYKPVGRQEMNGVFKEITEALGQVQVQGAATWSADGAPYPISAQVYHNGKQWLALRANSLPPSEGDDWTELFSGVYGSVRAVDSIADLLALLEGQRKECLGYLVKGYHQGLEGGGGVFYWDATKAKSGHNGGTVIDPTVAFPADWNNQAQLGTWLDTANVGTGCWVRQYDGAVNVKWFGAKGDGATDDTKAVQKALLIDGIFVPKGTYIVGDVKTFKNSINGETKNSTLKAKVGSSTVLLLQNAGDWDFTTIANINIDGNLKSSNGVTFGERTDGNDGRYTFENVFFTQCDKAIYKPRGNIGQEYNRVTVTSCNFGFYAIGQVSPRMHAGCDVFNTCHFGGGITTAAWYINNKVGGYGQTVLNNCICENNAGASVIIKNTRQLYQGVVINNLWTEGNTLNSDVIIEGVTYQTADYIFDNAKDITITNSFVKAVRLTDSSTLFLRDCRIDPQSGYFFVTKDSGSYIEASGQFSFIQYVSANILSKNIRISTYKPATLTNARASVFRTPDNASKALLPANKVISKSFSSPTTLPGSTNIVSVDVAEGNLYTNAGQFTVSPGASHYIGTFTTEVGKFYVVSLTSKTTGTVGFLGDASQTAIERFQSSDEFITQKAIIYAGEAKVIAPTLTGGASGGTATLREYQVVKFNTAEEAYDFLNSGKFVE